MFAKEQATEDNLGALADQCVRCGLCLPHCPTYRARLDEGESPRGRIALIQGLVSGELKAAPRLTAHLSSCLECRACEVACPSSVAFGALMDGGRAILHQRSSRLARWIDRARLHLLSSRRGAPAAGMICSIYRFTRLAGLIERFHLPAHSRMRALHRLAMHLKQPQEIPLDSPDDPDSAQEVGLFVGCVAQAAQPQLAMASWHVLTRLGFRARAPEQQVCCGAMHRHNGLPAQADRLLGRNATAFANLKIIATASACAAEFRAHPALSNTAEICRFLAELRWPPGAALWPWRERVAVHVPCSHRNALRDGDAAFDLLRRIPQIELVALEGNALCCGAAGTYLIESPEMSQTLLAPKISALKRSGVSYLVTTNTGCALHLAAGAREAGLSLQVMHPVQIIERQLPPLTT